RHPRHLSRRLCAAGGGLCAAAEHYRPRQDFLLLDCRRRARLGGLALAVFAALEPPVQNRAMKDDTADLRTVTVAAEADGEAAPVRKKARKKRAKAASKAATSAIETSIATKFAPAT